MSFTVDQVAEMMTEEVFNPKAKRSEERDQYGRYLRVSSRLPSRGYRNLVPGRRASVAARFSLGHAADDRFTLSVVGSQGAANGTSRVFNASELTEEIIREFARTAALKLR